MNLRYYLRKAQKGHWAMGQFNFSTLEQLKGIIAAAEKLSSPIILGTSEGESRFFGLKEAVLLRDFFRKKNDLPIFLNLDHGKSFDYLKEAVDLGYDMVHFDGSELLLEENIERTKKIMKYAKKFGVLVEGEIGIIERVGSGIKEENLTDPTEAKKFLNKTGVDCLAVSIGNLHGGRTGKVNPALRIERLKEIKSGVIDEYLVLHGGSGTPEEDIKEAIKTGIVKININTELRVAFTNTLKKELQRIPEEIVPYKYFPGVIEAVQKVVEQKIELFGSKKKLYNYGARSK